MAYESKWKKEADQQAMIDLNYEKRKQEWNQELDRRQYVAQK